ncbi:Spy/CpxP family protein refolding chaperone [Sporomusa malonica]|uniref:LTXXQ motif family protein n=1 Tax=Sporomusa malonica TaxID=112901 RepID=A0A1W1YBV4_9FIRM|nr:Spy/CpxP family protein refolding chaperone [Sporomusa malonica]SMC33700.1 LTXXQ motif family protein [Sporomusa malonica]
MIQTGKKLFTKLVPALVGIIMLTGFMVVGFDNNLAGMVVIAQASPVEGLNVSEQQKTEIQAIFRQANDQMKQLKANTHINRSPFARNQAKQQVEELFKQLQTIRTDAMGKVRNQLNPSQQASFDQLTAKIKEAGKNRTELLKSLELTQQQKMKIARAAEQSKEKTWDVLGDSTLSKEQKITQIKKMKQDVTNTIREQLTAEQQTKFDAWRQQQQEDFVF